ncbi:hypothetical protein CVS30_00260 [Arthrobacter psychrolactophilus]|uniref:Htaa domain-containing protein n=1 Tax=Arthrobacter psychrolactophilus TaxID=92442 RepID=A0A2V5IU24_9MICC|nr:hypothetical protein [Arthrobacter psychrolactophilus]PYI40009.1 hypothetical protein CVS30_00260 [Arthrobacter psychrolactophilus]
MTARRWVKSLVRKPLATTAAVAGLALAFSAFAVAPAQAADSTVSGAELSWGLNAESGAGAYNGSCNFLSAGTAGNTGSSRAWTEADGFYKSTEGNVSVVKNGPDATTIAATWANKCQTGAGTPVSPVGTAALSGNKIVFAEGTGTVDPVTGTATISWTGSFTSVFYGGLTYWSASNPVLKVKADGTATLKATASGYGADQGDTTVWTSIPATEITLANLTGVTVDDDGFTVNPDYLGVLAPAGVNQVNGGAAAGAFPTDFLSFQAATGTQPYWYSSGGGADPRKVASPVSVAWTVAATEPEVPAGDNTGVNVDVTVPEAPVTPEPGEFSWSIAATSATLGTATQNAGGTFGATGALPSITVKDNREGSAGWTINGKASNFTNSGKSFSGSALGWTPAASNPVGTVTKGGAVTAGNPGLAESRTLASTEAAGSATLDAGLTFLAPAGTSAGSYTSTLTITAISE